MPKSKKTKQLYSINENDYYGYRNNNYYDNESSYPNENNFSDNYSNNNYQNNNFEESKKGSIKKENYNNFPLLVENPRLKTYRQEYRTIARGKYSKALIRSPSKKSQSIKSPSIKSPSIKSPSIKSPIKSKRWHKRQRKKERLRNYYNSFNCGIRVEWPKEKTNNWIDYFLSPKKIEKNYCDSINQVKKKQKYFVSKRCFKKGCKYDYTKKKCIVNERKGSIKYRIDIDKLKKLSNEEIIMLKSPKLIKEFFNISDILANEIYNILFSKKKINKINSLLYEILKIKKVKTENFNKYRVYCVQGHGSQLKKPAQLGRKTREQEKFKTNPYFTDKISIKKLLRDLQNEHKRGDKYNDNNLFIYTMQSYGRFSSIYYGVYGMNKILNKEHLFKGLVNCSKKEELEILEKYIEENMIYNEIDIREKYPKKGNTLDLMKYHKHNLPDNFNISFNPRHNEEINGIYELPKTDKNNEENINDNEMQDLINLILQEPITKKGKMGLELEFNKKNKHLEKLLKYNKEINKTQNIGDLLEKKYEEIHKLKTSKFNKEKKQNIYSERQKDKIDEKYKNKNSGNKYLEDIIDVIYKVGNIKKDEKILILINACRGVKKFIQGETWDQLNNSLTFSAMNKARAYREASGDRMIKSLAK